MSSLPPTSYMIFEELLFFSLNFHFFIYKMIDSSAGVQNSQSPQHAPLGYVDYFELKATEILQAQEKLLPPLT